MKSNVDKGTDQEFCFFSSLAVISNQTDCIEHFHFKITNVVPFM